MSVTTRADEHLATVKENTHASVLALSEILINECWGHDEFNEDAKKNMEEAFDLLRKVRELLR